MHCSLVFVLFIAFGFCAAQNYTLPPCAQVCAGTAATAAGCYSSSNATCVCASQPFQAAIQSCFDTSCNTTTQGTAWQYYSYLCSDSDASSASSGASIYSGQSKTTTVSASTGSRPVTSHISSTQTSSLSSTQSANASSTTTSTSRTSTSTSGALGTEVERLCGFMAVVVGGALIL